MLRIFFTLSSRVKSYCAHSPHTQSACRCGQVMCILQLYSKSFVLKGHFNAESLCWVCSSAGSSLGQKSGIIFVGFLFFFKLQRTSPFQSCDVEGITGIPNEHISAWLRCRGCTSLQLIWCFSALMLKKLWTHYSNQFVVLDYTVTMLSYQSTEVKSSVFCLTQTGGKKITNHEVHRTCGQPSIKAPWTVV